MNGIQSFTPRLDDLIAHLRRQRWEQANSPKGTIQVWERGQDAIGETIRLVLPMSPDDPFAGQQIDKAINLLAALSDETPAFLAFKIAHRTSDLLLPRLVGSSIGSSIPFKKMSGTLEMLEWLIEDAFSQEHNPREHFDRASQKAKDYVRECRFGHTIHQSFGLTIECPVGLNPNHDLFGDTQGVQPGEAPLGRRVVERVAIGLCDLRADLEEGGPKKLFANFEKGFNANLCDIFVALVDMLEDIEFEMGILWSPEWRVSQAASRFKPTRIDRHAADYLRAASGFLRDDWAGPRETSIRGRIVNLHSDYPPIAGIQGTLPLVLVPTIQVLAPIDDHSQPMIVKVPLEAHEYTVACDAHKNGHQVSIQGLLGKVTRTGHYELIPTRPLVTLPRESLE